METDCSDAVDAAFRIFVDHVERLGTATRVLSTAEECQVPVLLSALQQCAQSRWDTFISGANRDSRPVLSVYMSDGWSTNVSRWHVTSVDHVAHIRRQGTERVEFLAEKMIARTYNDSGCVDTAFLLWPGGAMGRKLGVDIFAASLNRPFMPRHCAGSICIIVYLQDGLHASSFLRRQKIRHRLYHEQLRRGEADAEAGRIRD